MCVCVCRLLRGACAPAAPKLLLKCFALPFDMDSVFRVGVLFLFCFCSVLLGASALC